MTSDYANGTQGASEAPQAILERLHKLDVLLRRAVERARVLYAAGESDATFHGIYISESEIDSLLERAGGETLGSDASISEALNELLSTPRLDPFGERWEFTNFDNAALLLALAPEVDLRYERIYAYLQDDVTKRKPTVDLALNLLCDSPETRIAQRVRFAPESPLLRSGLLRLLPDPSHVEPPLLAQYLRLDERATQALLGDNSLDSRLEPFCERGAFPATRLDLGDEGDIVRRLVAYTTATRNGGRPVRFLFSGPATADKRRAVEALAAASHETLLAADLARHAVWRERPTETAALLVREATLSNAIAYIADLEPGASEEAAAKTFITVLDEYPGVVVIASESPLIAELAGGDRFLHVRFTLPDFDARLALWGRLTREAGIAAGSNILDTLASNFLLAPEQIEAAVNTARQKLEWCITATGKLSPKETEAELLAAARSQTGAGLASLTSKLKPVYGWDDIVLPEDQLEQLREICGRVTHGHDVLEGGGFGRKLSAGKGVTVLFAGPSGTGKTMAAEVIANELGLNLFRIDLSRVVSKYIGETEKNLESIFTAAVRSNSVLLFDEADSLFGKRSAVRDAHDRYANIEVSYLLQKMEEHEGITILTSNLRGNIDEAFLRRLAFTIHFPFPEEEKRLEIWRRIWPAETQLAADVDLAALAERFRLSGGNIRNVALSAAFLAASASRPVGMEEILRAIRREYAKVGKSLTTAELEEAVR